MPNESAIIRSLQTLRRNIRAGEVPALDDLPELAADWMAILSDVSDDGLSAAVVAWLRGACPFWPTPGQLLALVPVRQLAALDDAAEAWAHVKGWIRCNGYREPIAGQLDPVDARRDAAMLAGLRALGGAAVWGQMATEAEPFTAKRFEGEYREGRTRAAVVAEHPALLGAARLLGPIEARGGQVRRIGGR